LVLLDYRLNSSITATDAVQRIKELFGAVPIIVLSELQWMPDDMRNHAVAFISKGEPDIMLDTIKEVLKKQARSATP
jgi:hypothetical protein